MLAALSTLVAICLAAAIGVAVGFVLGREARARREEFEFSDDFRVAIHRLHLQQLRAHLRRTYGLEARDVGSLDDA